MPKSLKYIMQEKIYESNNSQVFRAFDESDNRPVILKRLNKGYPTPDDISEFYREYELTSMFVNEGVIQVYGISRSDNTPAIVMEDIGGRSLADILKTRRLKLDEFLNFALNIVITVGNIHNRNIIHKDINPANIIWNMEKNVTRIIDFGIATELPREIMSVKNPNVLEGTLEYISPEQTGRMNRAVDYRTDFYSLGVTFYYAITGRHPFATGDLLKLLHSHIAVLPVPPHDIDRTIPKSVSAIIMKLMAKNAEDRYRSTHGLICDIERCIQELNGSGTINDFDPGMDDISYKFQIPQKLYGRENEISSIMSAFERVSEGDSELMLVSGYSGIGKSFLINELQKPIVKHRGYYISGKYEKLKKDVPYSGIIQALTKLAKQILAENNSEIELWKENILDAAGQNGKIITDLVPLFELIIGKQPEIPVLAPVESQNRFNLVFQGFLKTLASKEHPLVVFLDDLQWADLASLHLMELFAADPDIKYLFMIGAYRNNETPDTHPLHQVVAEIKNSGTTVNSIVLNPLRTEHICQLLGDTLNHEPVAMEPLAGLLISKTAGNPFFINEFLHYLYKKRFFEFSFKEGWYWDMPGIEKMNVTDNVVDLMVQKIISLPAESQDILKLGACMGSYFTFETMKSVCGREEQFIRSSLNEILIEGILYRHDDIYRFSHDRILEAAYSLISEEEKIEQHYRIGNLELQVTDKEKLHDKIFYIVNHLNAGVQLVKDTREKRTLSELNLEAGKKALLSNAYESSLNYFKAGISLLDEESWRNNYSLTLSLYQEAVIAAQLSAEYETMQRLAAEVYENAGVILDKIKVYEAEIFACIAQNRLQDGISIGLDVLKKLGLSLPARPGKLRIIYELISLKFFLAGKPVENLINLPEMKSPRMLAIMQILTGLATSAYYAAPALLPLVIFNTVRLSVKHGNSIYSPYAYAGFGMTHCGTLGNIKSGYQWGQLALKLIEKYNIIQTKSRVWMVVQFFINHWKRPLNESLKPLLEAYNSGIETGELEFASLAAATYVISMFSSGRELSSVEKEMSGYIDTVKKFKQDTILTYVRMHHQNVLNLRGLSNDPCIFTGSSYNREEMLPAHKKINDISAFFYLYFYSMTLNYTFENYSEAYLNAELVKPYSDAQISNPYLPLINFYDSLSRLALYPGSEKHDRKKHMRCIAINQKKMKKWSYHAPENYCHKYHLVEAETARIRKKELEARENYLLAIKFARENGFLHEEALALKLAAKFWLELNEKKTAALYMTEALHRYKIWGADAVVKQIGNKYSFILQLNNENPRSYPGTTLSGTSSKRVSDLIDISTVIKTSQILSSEIDLSRLLEAIMKLSIENAGAQRGFLVLENEDNKKLYIEAIAESDKIIKVVEPVPVEQTNGLSSAIVFYVNRTGESVVLNNACKEGSFVRDPYIMENRVRSLLCTPVTYKGKTSGILYLENNLATNVFTAERLELLNILSSQAAISVENARLMAHRENKAKFEKEIEMAEKIQRSLLPDDVPELGNIRVAYKYIPMIGIGGDFVNIYHKNGENKIGIFICDVSGHGIYAAMIASMVSNSLDFFWDEHFDDPAVILRKMHSFLKGKMGGNFFTGCICSIDLDTGKVTMANAGHPPLILINKNGNMEMKAAKGRLISESIDPNTENIVFFLEKGDTLILYTDGITEAENPEGVAIGGEDEEFCRWIKDHYMKTGSPDTLCESIYAGVLDHTGKEQLNDDFTILILDYMLNTPAAGS